VKNFKIVDQNAGLSQFEFKKILWRGKGLKQYQAIQNEGLSQY
jgi:hypothetical protein